MECQADQDKIEYIQFSDLKDAGVRSPQELLDALGSNMEWKKHFQALSNSISNTIHQFLNLFQLKALLRSNNKFHPQIFVRQLFPHVSKQVGVQVDNLRSNNSKEALVLLTQIVEFNNLANFDDSSISLIISRLFGKSASQKGFLKNEALKGVKLLQKAHHPRLLLQVSQQTQNPNYVISELAILVLKGCLENNIPNKNTVDLDIFFRILIRNLNGKRSLIQKTSKEILSILDKSIGEQLKSLIQSINLSKEETEILLTEIRNLKAGGPSKAKVSLKEFLKQKKQGPGSTSD